MKYVELLIQRVGEQHYGLDDTGDIEEALRIARIPGYSAFCEQMNREGVTKKEAGRLNEAVYKASRSYLDIDRRFALLIICLRNGDQRVKAEVESELARIVTRIRRDENQLFQGLIALHDLGESVYPKGKRSFGTMDYSANVAAAEEYLRIGGYLGSSSSVDVADSSRSMRKRVARVSRRK